MNHYILLWTITTSNTVAATGSQEFNDKKAAEAAGKAFADAHTNYFKITYVVVPK